jgi:hypothetical protein
MDKFAIFHIEGGLGKHVASTAVAECIKNNYPDRKLIVVCAYAEVFLNLKFIDRVYKIGMTPYFYNDYIDGKDSLIFKHEPYFTTEHIHKKMPLIENWCKLYNLNYSGEIPSLIFNSKQKQLGINKWTREKPIMVIQTNGGPLVNQPYINSWTRDIPVYLSEILVNHYRNDYHIIQICRSGSVAMQGVEVVSDSMPNMELFSLLLVSQKRVLIDSCLQHAAASLGLSSVVLWVGTSPKVFGYNIHTNIVADLPKDIVKLPDSYLFDYSFEGLLHEYPSLESEIFDPNLIIQKINL